MWYNLQLPISSLLISNKKVLSCNWLTDNNNFWCCRKLKMWISDTLFEQNRFSFDNLIHVAFWTKGELVYKNQLQRLVLESQFQNPGNLDGLLYDSYKNNFKFTKEQKIDQICFHTDC